MSWSARPRYRAATARAQHRHRHWPPAALQDPHDAGQGAQGGPQPTLRLVQQRRRSSKRSARAPPQPRSNDSRTSPPAPAPRPPQRSEPPSTAAARRRRNKNKLVSFAALGVCLQAARRRVSLRSAFAGRARCWRCWRCVACCLLCCACCAVGGWSGATLGTVSACRPQPRGWRRLAWMGIAGGASRLQLTRVLWAFRSPLLLKAAAVVDKGHGGGGSRKHGKVQLRQGGLPVAVQGWK